MKQHRRRLEGNLGAAALRAAMRAMQRRSPEQAEILGQKLGRRIHGLAKSRRERCQSNLRMAFPEMDASEIERLTLKVFEHYGIVTADFLRAKARTREELVSSMTVTGREHLDTALAQGKGVVLITGHFGNWERLSAWLSVHGYTLTVVSRAVSNAALNQMVNALRETTGTRVVERGDAARPMLEALRRNELVGILPDQNTDPDQDGIFLPFFGKPAGTVLGPGVISERTGAPVVPCWCIRTGLCEYHMRIEAPLEPVAGCERKGEGTMRAIQGALEAVIRENPEQWLWFHDRWKAARHKGLL